MNNKEVYLGDSVYAKHAVVEGTIKLYTNNGFGPQNVIYLEKSVFNALLLFANQIWGKQ